MNLAIGTRIHTLTTNATNWINCVHHGYNMILDVMLLQSKVKFKTPIPPRPDPTNATMFKD